MPPFQAFQPENCVGKAANVDKVVTGSIESLGKKIVVTVKILNVESGLGR